MHWLLFWMLGPFDNDITDQDWEQYLDSLSWEYLLWVVVFVIVVCLLYVVCTRCLTTADIQSAFWPMRLLWLAIIPGVIVGIRAGALFDSFDGLRGKQGAIPAGISSGFMAAITVVVFSWLSFLLPVVTPPMFATRPYAWTTWIKRKLNGENGGRQS